MFKLLLATDDPEVQRAYGEINDWERLGFRQPRTASTADEATDSLTHHHADAVIIALAPQEEQKLIHAMACDHWRLRPILTAGRNRNEIQRDLVELEILLSRTHADYSNDPYSEETMMQLSRHEGQELDYILSGRIIFSYEGLIEELGPGDCIMYDSGRGHGLEAIGGEPCVLLAVVIHPQERKEIPRGEF